MDYSREELKKIYLEAKNNRLVCNELQDIKSQLCLVCQRFAFDEYIMEDVIKTLQYFKEVQVLNKINIESLNLLSRMIYLEDDKIFDDNDNIFFVKYLRFLYLPSYLNKCDKEYNLGAFLGEFDIFTSLIKDNCGNSDYILLKKYNKELFEIVGRYTLILNKYEEMNIYKFGNNFERILVTTVFNHLATLLYFSLDKYNYQYDLLNEVCDNILNNYMDFLEYISESNLDMQLNDLNSGMLREYEMCNEFLRQAYMPPIKVKKR